MRKIKMLGIIIFCLTVLIGCVINMLYEDNIIQSIRYGKKKIEVYTTNAGNFSTETINISIISWYSRYLGTTDIFTATYHSSKINIMLSMEASPPILEVFYYNIREDEVRLKKETIEGIKVVYIEVDKNYNFLGY